MRVELVSDVQQRNNRATVKTKMERTFALRRREVIGSAPMVSDFQERWPALFDVVEVWYDFLCSRFSCQANGWPNVSQQMSCVCISVCHIVTKLFHVSDKCRVQTNCDHASTVKISLTAGPTHCKSAENI